MVCFRLYTSPSKQKAPSEVLFFQDICEYGTTRCAPSQALRGLEFQGRNPQARHTACCTHPTVRIFKAALIPIQG
jgi:hypothetical protein